MFLNIVLASITGSVLALIGGVILLWKEEFARKISLTLLSFAAGSLIGAAFLELIPEALAESEYEPVGLLIVFGILAIFLFEKLLYRYHDHSFETDGRSLSGTTILLGDTLHNFIDGVAIAVSFAAGTEVGLATTIAVFFHEIPQEIGDFGALIHLGYSKSKVLLYNFVTALSAVVGAVLGYVFLASIEKFIPGILAFAAGSFIYIAVSDLLPEIKHKAEGGDFGHLLSIVLGVAVVWFVGTALPE